MWGEPGSQDWIDHDPKLGIENLKDMTVYVSAGSGRDDFGTPDSVAKGKANPAGVGLEVISRLSTQTFVDYASRTSVKPIVRFRPSGVHSWEYWQFEMAQAWPYMANALNVPEADRGSKCTPIGAPLIGWVGDVLGPRWTIGIGSIAVGVALVGAWVWLRMVHDLSVTFDRHRPWITVAVPAPSMPVRRALDPEPVR